MLTTVTFMIVVESAMVIPYAGVLVKVSLGALLGVQTLVMFRDVAEGKKPSLRPLLRAFARPPATLVAIVVSALVPFASGVAYLACVGGTTAARFFFDPLHAAPPPSTDLLLQAKCVMYLVMLPFTFVGAAVVFEHRHGLHALTRGVCVALDQSPVLAVIFACACAFECSTALAVKACSHASLRVGVALLLATSFVAWSFAFVAAVALRIYNIYSGR